MSAGAREGVPLAVASRPAGAAATEAASEAEVQRVATGALVNAQRGGRWPAIPAIPALLDPLCEAYPPAAACGELAAAAAAFGLDDVELRALAIVAAVEIDARFGALLALLQGAAEALRPSVATLADVCGRDAVALLGPTSRLRRSALVDVDGTAPLPFRYAMCPERVWLRLTGGDPVTPERGLDAASLDLPGELVQAIAALAAWLGDRGRTGLVVLCGPPGAGRQAVAAAIAHAAGLAIVRADAAMLGDRARCVELERTARWDRGVAVITSEDTAPSAEVGDWLDRAQVPRIWIQPGVPDWAGQARAAVRVLELRALDSQRRAAVWQRLLAGRGGALDPDELALRYRFGPGRIRRVLEIAGGEGHVTPSSLAVAARATTRPGIAAIAARLAARTRDELIVPPAVARELELAIGWATMHARLYRAWNLDATVARARGVTSLFVGPPGTGKTMAAQILAGEIGRDLFRVDLSQAVSKWLGETEKNLGRLFDEAQDAGAVLFFDEADALFARRTQVRDSHDRYANLETGYLLQRLEDHDGVVVLASNRRADLDSAFLRRFDVVVEFTLPGTAERQRLWRVHLPPGRHAVSDDELAAIAALFELSGGQIRNAVLTAVAMLALAGSSDARLGAATLVRAAARELHSAGRLVNPAEFGAWAGEVRAALPGAGA